MSILFSYGRLAVGGVIVVIVVIVVWIAGEHSYIIDYDYCQTGSKAYGHAVWGGTWANLSMQDVNSPSISPPQLVL